MTHPPVYYHECTLHTGSDGVPTFGLNSASLGGGYGCVVLQNSDLGEFNLGAPQLDFDEAVNLSGTGVNSQLNVKRSALVTATIPVLVTAVQSGELEGKLEWLRKFLRQATFYLDYTQYYLYNFSPSGSTWPATFPNDFARSDVTDCYASSSKFVTATSGDTAERGIYWNTQANTDGRPRITYGSIWKFANSTQVTAYTAGTYRRLKLWIYDSAGTLLRAPYLTAAVTATDASPVYSEVFYQFTEATGYSFHAIFSDVMGNPNTMTAEAYGVYAGPSWRYPCVASPEPQIVIDHGFVQPGVGTPVYRARVLVEVLHSPNRYYGVSGSGVA